MKTIAVTMLFFLSGCASMFQPAFPMHQISPSVSADGVKKFMFVVTENHYSYQPDPEKARLVYLESDLGSIQYCMNGYSIDETEAYSGIKVYRGTCK